MGYPNFGKVKTIVLPADHDEMTLEEYKQKYGIDIKSFLSISVSGGGDKGRISLVIPSNIFILINGDDLAKAYNAPQYGGCQAITSIDNTDWDSGVSNAILILKGGHGVGLYITCNKDNELNFDNIRIQGNEI